MSIGSSRGFPWITGKAAATILALLVIISCSTAPQKNHHSSGNEYLLHFRPDSDPPKYPPSARLESTLTIATIPATGLTSARPRFYTWYLNGEFQQRSPSPPLPWPTAVQTRGNDRIFVSIDTSIQPELVEVTVTQNSGGKRNSIHIISDTQCTPYTDNPCWLNIGSRGHGMEITVAAHGVSHVGVTGLWYVPRALTRKDHLPDSLVFFSASWLFSVRAP